MAHATDALDERSTWHHGLVARWWAEFNREGPDIGFFQRVIERSGEPALDLACGTGRLLIPFLRAGLDVDGCDLSSDMLSHCAARAEKEGLRVQLSAQRMCDLDLPRRYKTIVLCGSFGVGTSRSEDLAGLRRAHQHLEPGGTLAFDIELPNFPRQGWGAWLAETRAKLPTPWPERGDRRTCEDGTELELKQRVLSFDPLEQITTRALRVEHWVDGQLATLEERPISLNIYFKNEVVLMLETAGFRQIRATGGLTDTDARPFEDERIVVSGLR
jgi:SAM-dependent methyltransferase